MFDGFSDNDNDYPKTYDKTKKLLIKKTMKIIRKIRLCFTFYTYFLFASLTIDAMCMSVMWHNGIGAYSSLFWLKLASMGAIFYLVNEYKKQEYYYFYNFGLSKKLLWIVTLSLDLILFYILTIITFQLR